MPAAHIRVKRNWEKCLFSLYCLLTLYLFLLIILLGTRPNNAENEKAHTKPRLKEPGELGGTESNLDTEMKTDDYTQRNKTAANGFTGGTGKERPPDRRSDIQ